MSKCFIKSEASRTPDAPILTSTTARRNRFTNAHKPGFVIIERFRNVRIVCSIKQKLPYIFYKAHINSVR